MKTPPKVQETLSKIKQNKETLFAILLAGTRWFTGGFVMPLTFVVCRLLLDKALDRRNVVALKQKMDLIQRQMGRFNSMDEANDAAKVYDETKEILKAEQRSVKTLQKSYEEALALVDDELKKNRNLRKELDLVDEENKTLKSSHAIEVKFGGSSEDLQKKIKALEAKKKDLENLLRAERQDTSALKASEREALALRDAEARQNRVFKKEMERLQEDNKKMKGLVFEVTEKDLIISSKDQNIEVLEKESSEKQVKVEELEANRKDLMSVVDSEKERSSNLDGDLQNEKAKSQGLEKDLEAETHRGVEKDELYSISKDTLAAEQAKTASLDGVQRQLTEELQAERLTVAKQQDTIGEKDTLIAIMKEFEAEIQTITETVQSKDADSHESTKAMLTSMTEKLTQMKEEHKQIPELKKHVTSLEQSMAEKESVLSAENAKTGALNKKYEALKLTLSSAFEERTSVEQKFAELRKNYDQVSDAKKLLDFERETTTKLHQEVGELTHMLSIAKSSNVKLEMSLDEKTNVAEANEALLTETNEKVESLEKETTNMKQEITDLTASLDVVTTNSKNAEEIEAERDGEKEKNTKLQKDVDDLTTSLDEELSKVDRLENTLKRKEATITDSEATIESLEAGNRQLDGENKKFQEVESEVGRLNNYLGSMKLTVDELQESLEDRQNQVNELTEKNATLTAEKENINEERKMFQTEERRRQQSLANVDQDLQAELDKLKSLTQENAQLKAADSRTEETMKKLQSTLEKKGTILISKEEDIARLQKELANAENKMNNESSTSDHQVNALATQNEKLQQKQEEVYKKLEDLTFSSQNIIKELSASLEIKEKTLNQQQEKVQSLQKQLEAKDSQKDEAINDVANRIDEEFRGIKKQLNDTKTGYESEKLKVINLEALKKTSQKMIQDLEAILDKKETILSQKQEDITALKQDLEKTGEACESEKMRSSELEEKIKKGDFSGEVAKLKALTESQSEYFHELKKRESSMKKNLADATQKLKLRDMLLVSGAFHGAATSTTSTPLASPSGAPTPENRNPWGKRR
jgi:chromosome segregation ATPase